MDAKVEDAPAPELELPEQPSEIKIRLRKAVMAHGEMVKVLTFRAPTGGDVMALGDQYPLHMDLQTGEVRINPLPMGQIMSPMAQVPPSTIRLLTAKDWGTCALALVPFFVPDDPATRS